VAIDPVVLRRMYVDEALTVNEIAARLGCAATTIFRRLRRFGIPVRRRGPVPLRVSAGDFPAWTPDLAWVVGVIATDGNLSSSGRHLAIPSIDRDLLESLRACLGLRNRIFMYKTDRSSIYRLQWGDRVFYDWLLSIGLTPAKSLTLGPLRVPDDYFADFVRGCIDGDGSVLVYTDRYHTAKKERYIYERLYVSLVSASQPFIEWVQRSVLRLGAVAGSIGVSHPKGHHPIWKLRYAKAESIRILRWMYYSPTVPCLARKRITAEPFLVPRGRPPQHGPGRPMVV
jgi:hypothetical protein